MATEPTTKTLADGQPVLTPMDGRVVGDLDSKLKNESDPASGSETDEINDGGVNEKALIRKIDWRLLPAVGILYLLSFLDRSNVGNARIEGLTDDVHMTGNQYLTGLTLYFIGYVIFEVRERALLLLASGLVQLNANRGLVGWLRCRATSFSRGRLLGSGCRPSPSSGALLPRSWEWSRTCRAFLRHASSWAFPRAVCFPGWSTTFRCGTSGGRGSFVSRCSLEPPPLRVPLEASWPM